MLPQLVPLILFGIAAGFSPGPNNIITSLLGFNLGVEIGQIIFVLIILAVIWMLTKLRFNKTIELVKNTAFIFVTTMGFFWFIQRLVI